MWIDKRLPMLRRHPGLGIIVSVGLVASVVVLKGIFPDLPAFLPLYPVVLLSAFIGGRYPGILAWTASTILGAYYFSQTDGFPGNWGYLTIFGFACVCALIVFIVDLLDRAIQRLEFERNRLALALKAASLATWELHPDGRLRWDENFYHMVGLDPTKDPPSTEKFLAMVHPEDRARMFEARSRMSQGEPPTQKEEYRLTRPDGRMVWLENYRAAVKGERQHFIGITQDISSRKGYERRIKGLMRELAHRVKNQYAVILAMVRETNKQARTPQEFESLIQSRIAALARSHDLLVHGEWESADLKDLLLAHVEAFGLSDRLAAEGPPVALSAMAAQYFGMAFHELCTNAVKHGAFSVPTGRVRVRWEVRDGVEQNNFILTWQEMNGPAPQASDSPGFGSKVLTQLMPTAISGTSETELAPGGLIWRVKGRLESLQSNDD
ncbi:PAS domain-containing protein [Nordella sp. HKS 07]|uniref:HWE histidine kinase domain-containing protein n=1 Tax=Nordella sp. HKS 07 TaxID=2712222 RepID=UPI0013E18CBD|nr:HWE histidine kinase domain-containing protein [Nordella sp. HKS 07]QIG47501.1 PAS domain-containing protein [Nordella sp. HKS 07]